VRHPFVVAITGPKGTGKSTLYDQVIHHRLKAPFINADLIQREELGEAAMEASYRAAEIAAQRRQAFVERGESFAFESVFSHPSKLDTLKAARDAGFRIIVFHVGVASPAISVARVTHRVGEGGHPVPEEKVRERFARNLRLIRQAVTGAHRGLVYDNSRLNTPLHLVLEFDQGRLAHIRDPLPEWVARVYGPRLPERYRR